MFVNTLAAPAFIHINIIVRMPRALQDFILDGLG